MSIFIPLPFFLLSWWSWSVVFAFAWNSQENCLAWEIADGFLRWHLFCRQIDDDLLGCLSVSTISGKSFLLSNKAYRQPNLTPVQLFYSKCVTPRPQKARHNLVKYSLLLKGYCMTTYLGTLLNVCCGNIKILSKSTVNLLELEVSERKHVIFLYVYFIS